MIVQIALLTLGIILTAAGTLFPIAGYGTVVALVGVLLLTTSWFARPKTAPIGAPGVVDVATPRPTSWPMFLAVLLVLLNGIALAFLYEDDSLRVDGVRSVNMVRRAFMSTALLNLILAGSILVLGALRRTRDPSAER